MVYADSSFLFSVVLHDANTARAVGYLKLHATTLVFTPLQRFELRNAVRLAVWRGNCDSAAARRALGRLATDIASGNLAETTLDWTEVLAKADELSEDHTSSLGVRSLDLLHVAAAVTLGARTFITCDERQMMLARASGLKSVRV
jgi:hypothetical protein